MWTETWVRTQGALAAAAFSAYWLGIGLFSAWIRRIFLREARARAESARVRKASAEDEEVEHEPEDPTVREQARVAEEQPLPEDREESRQPTPDVIPSRESRVVTGVGPTIPCVEPDMDATSTFRAALWFAGAVAIVAGLVHAGWHFFFRAYPEMGGLRESHWEVFSLFNFSVGLLLLFMGAVAIAAAASRASTLAQLRTLSAFLAATWTVRFLLELAYPVRIPLLVVTAPSALLRVLMGAMIAVLVAPQLMLMMGAARRSAPP